MKVTVIGLGRVGLVAAAGLAFASHEVLATDIDGVRLNQLKAGRSPFFEPGLPQRITSASRDGSLRILPMDDFHDGLGDIALVAAGTPTVPGGSSGSARRKSCRKLGQTESGRRIGCCDEEHGSAGHRNETSGG